MTHDPGHLCRILSSVVLWVESSGPVFCVVRNHARPAMATDAFANRWLCRGRVATEWLGFQELREGLRADSAPDD